MGSPVIGFRVKNWSILLSLVIAPLASAQILPFRLQVTQGIIQPGSTIPFAAPVGQSQTIRVTATYLGTGQVLISEPQPTIVGSGAFTASYTSVPPLTVVPQGTFSFDIQFSPVITDSSNAQISVAFSEMINANTTPGTINLNLQGAVSSLVLSYVLPSNQNVVPLLSGGTVVFPATPINTTAQAALNLTNRGTAAGVVTGISITGSAFQLSGLPLFPISVPAGQNSQVTILYKPTGTGLDTGQITITFDVGPPVTINLQGGGNSSSLVYQLLSTNPPTTVSPGGTVTLPDTKVGQTGSVMVGIMNSGNASATVSSISIPGQVFQLSNVPLLPQTLAPGASLTFTVTFTPTQPGTLAGTLIVNSDTLNLSGVGLGSQLVFSYVLAGATITLGTTNSSVIFSPVAISQSAQLSLDVKNTGTAAATIASIGIGQTNSPFVLSGLPALPATLAPNADFHIAITFTPVALGFTTGTILVDATTIGLTGSGTQPPALPAYTISGPSGTAAPGSQPSIGLTLASPYPVAIAGTLTVDVTGSLPADPAIQFATAGRTVAFVIPANSTTAVFGSQGAKIGLQTGTVADTVTITPSFSTQAGNVSLTPTTPPVLQFSIAPAAPTLIAMQLTNETPTSFLISVTGFSTSRTLTAWNVQFTTVPGVVLSTSQFTLDVQSVSTVWFRSAASQAFGSQFTLAIPISFQGLATTQSVLDSIASVVVTMNNEIGTSNSVQVKVH